MIIKLGPVKVKEKILTDTIEIVPPSREYTIGGAFLGSYGGGSLPVKRGQSRIVYTTKAKSARLQSNMCRHYRDSHMYRGNASVPSRIFWHMPNPSNYTDYTQHHFHATVAHSQAIVNAKTALGVNLGSSVIYGNALTLINEGFSRAKPDLTTLSLPNFLLEIKQLQLLFSLWKKNVSLAKNVAGARLNVEFGWKPTIGDLTDLTSLIRACAAALHDFESKLNSIVSDRVTLFKNDRTISGQFNLGANIQSPVNWSATLTNSLTAHFKYVPQQISAMNDLDKILRALIDSLGFELNPRIIWDAIPFTFVIDWFFGVGRWLERFKVDALELPIVLVDSALQYKERLAIESSLVMDAYEVSYKPPTQCPSWVTVEDYFERCPIYPDFATFSGLGWKTPSMNQAINFLALATVLK